MSKINIVRSIKTKNIRDDANHNREMGWDNRFHLAKLQPYDAYQDAYCTFILYKVFYKISNFKFNFYLIPKL